MTSKVQEISPEETKEKSLFESLKSQVEQLKLLASEKHQKGLYDDAIHIYNKALKEIQDQESSFKFLSTSILLLKTALWNNIALCYKQLQNTDGELEFCSRVIDYWDALVGLGHGLMVAKAFARRGFCYEKEEKLKRAKEDFLQVRGLNPADVEATNALRRIE